MLHLTKIKLSRMHIGGNRYKSERMSKIRGDVLGWMQEYERAQTAKHRDVCMEHIQMNLKRYEYYGHR